MNAVLACRPRMVLTQLSNQLASWSLKRFSCLSILCSECINWPKYKKRLIEKIKLCKFKDFDHKIFIFEANFFQFASILCIHVACLFRFLFVYNHSSYILIRVFTIFREGAINTFRGGAVPISHHSILKCLPPLKMVILVWTPPKKCNILVTPKISSFDKNPP